MGFHEGDMTARDYIANKAARFQPAIDASRNNGAFALPCIEIGGVQVYAYIRDGILVVSVHYDTADISDAGPFALYGGGHSSPDGERIPTVIDLGGERVWEELPEDACSEADAMEIRRASDDPDDWPAHVVPDWALFPGTGPDDAGQPDTLQELRERP